MSPGTGRPKSENSKSVKMNIRISPDTATDLLQRSKALGIPRAAVIEKGIQLVKAELNKE